MLGSALHDAQRRAVLVRYMRGALLPGASRARQPRVLEPQAGEQFLRPELILLLGGQDVVIQTEDVLVIVDFLGGAQARQIVAIHAGRAALLRVLDH